MVSQPPPRKAASSPIPMRASTTVQTPSLVETRRLPECAPQARTGHSVIAVKIRVGTSLLKQ